MLMQGIKNQLEHHEYFNSEGIYNRHHVSACFCCLRPLRPNKSRFYEMRSPPPQTPPPTPPTPSPFNPPPPPSPVPPPQTQADPLSLTLFYTTLYLQTNIKPLNSVYCLFCKYANSFKRQKILKNKGPLRKEHVYVGIKKC